MYWHISTSLSNKKRFHVTIFWKLSEPEIVVKFTFLCNVSEKIEHWWRPCKDLERCSLRWQIEASITWLTPFSCKLKCDLIWDHLMPSFFQRAIISFGTQCQRTESGLNHFTGILSNCHFSQNSVNVQQPSWEWPLSRPSAGVLGVCSHRSCGSQGCSSVWREDKITKQKVKVSTNMLW